MTPAPPAASALLLPRSTEPQAGQCLAARQLVPQRTQAQRKSQHPARRAWFSSASIQLEDDRRRGDRRTEGTPSWAGWHWQEERATDLWDRPRRSCCPSETRTKDAHLISGELESEKEE